MVVVLLVFSVLILSSSALADEVQCGDTIRQDTVLKNDLLECGGGVALRISGDRITLDCNGHAIEAARRGVGTGIKLTRFNSHATIKNCRISRFFVNIELSNGAHDNLIKNNVLTWADAQGIAVYDADENNRIEDNVLYRNRQGILMASLNGDAVDDAVVDDNVACRNSAGDFKCSCQSGGRIVACNTVRNWEPRPSMTGEGNFFARVNCPDLWPGEDDYEDCVEGMTEDPDEDGWPNVADNCPNSPNPQQEDSNGDDIGDACQDDDDNDGAGDGDDNCPAIANPDQEDLDEDGVGDVCDDDIDGDDFLNEEDNCPDSANPGQEDQEGDGVGDACDLCLEEDDPDQENFDGDEAGDACDSCPLKAGPQGDRDHDGVGDTCDNCRSDGNPHQEDGDGDYIGDSCDPCPEHVDPFADERTCSGDADGDGTEDLMDPDDDGDTILDGADNCPLVTNRGQEDMDNDGIGDMCDPDQDGDDTRDVDDNCPSVANANQADEDGDGIGNSCEGDSDGDGINNDADICPNDADPDQEDSDEDGKGDACDNCPDDANPNQEDNNRDGVGNVCEVNEADALVHHYDFNEDSVADVISGSVGEIYRNPDIENQDDTIQWRENGREEGNGAYLFWRNRNHLKLADETKDLALGEGSVAVWAKYSAGRTSTHDRWIFGRNSDGKNAGDMGLYYHRGAGDTNAERRRGKIRFFIEDGTGDGSRFILSNDNFADWKDENDGWHFYVGTWNDDEVALYIDGVKQQDVKAGVELKAHQTHRIAIGSPRPVRHENGWNGFIDDFKIYNYVLTEDEIRELAGLEPLVPPNPVCNSQENRVTLVGSEEGASKCYDRIQEIYPGDEVEEQVAELVCSGLYLGHPIVRQGNDGFQYIKKTSRRIPISSDINWRAQCPDYLETNPNGWVREDEFDAPRTFAEARKCIDENPFNFNVLTNGGHELSCPLPELDVEGDPPEHCDVAEEPRTLFGSEEGSSICYDRTQELFPGLRPGGGLSEKFCVGLYLGHPIVDMGNNNNDNFWHLLKTLNGVSPSNKWLEQCPNYLATNPDNWHLPQIRFNSFPETFDEVKKCINEDPFRFNSITRGGHDQNCPLADPPVEGGDGGNGGGEGGACDQNEDADCDGVVNDDDVCDSTAEGKVLYVDGDNTGCQLGDINKNNCIDLGDWGVFLGDVASDFENEDYEGLSDLNRQNGLDLGDWGLFLDAVANDFVADSSDCLVDE